MRMQLCLNLTFKGDCEAAFAFYEACFHGKTVFLLRYENTPMDLQAPADWGNKVSHATFEMAGFQLCGSDAPPAQYEKTRGLNLQLNLKDAAEAERIFNMLSDGGTVSVPLAETFWALRFGQVEDRFGIPWLINCEKPASS